MLPTTNNLLLTNTGWKHRTRNRAIARAFKEAGIIEQYGSGIKRIKDECKQHGVIEPKFEEFVHGFRVTLYKEKLQNINVGVDVGVNEVLEYIRINQPVKEIHCELKNADYLHENGLFVGNHQVGLESEIKYLAEVLK